MIVEVSVLGRRSSTGHTGGAQVAQEVPTRHDRAAPRDRCECSPWVPRTRGTHTARAAAGARGYGGHGAHAPAARNSSAQRGGPTRNAKRAPNMVNSVDSRHRELPPWRMVMSGARERVQHGRHARRCMLAVRHGVCPARKPFTESSARAPARVDGRDGGRREVGLTRVS